MAMAAVSTTIPPVAVGSPMRRGLKERQAELAKQAARSCSWFPDEEGTETLVKGAWWAHTRRQRGHRPFLPRSGGSCENEAGMSACRSDSRYHGHPPRYLTSPLLARVGLPHLFSTRHFPGVRAWKDPRGPFDASALAPVDRGGLPAEGFAFARQVHGADLVVATRGGSLGQADVLMTEQPGLPLAIFTADCLPIVVYDRANRRLAMAHAGWRGTVEAAARVAVNALVEAGGRPEAFLAAIGPSIGPCCYEVDAPVIDRLEAAFPGAWGAWAK